ncbi:MAG TPA: xanthine dehydrogenase family protein subunit M [Chloroflexota bacterium]|nr:xanthine dehydrogenase family protein subunit M [Chloroflexota bacterium]
MIPFSYSRASDVGAAVAEVAAEPGAAFIAGATELANWMKIGIQAPTHLVDINALPLSEIAVRQDGLRLGGLARMSDVATTPAIRQGYPVLSEALERGASAQIRNMGTMGGNLLQRTRCPYFREASYPCNKREPGAGCAALTGPHRLHAIFGASDACIAVHPSDLAVALTVLDAVVHTQSPGAERAIPIGELYRPPGDTPDRETALEHGELIVAVEIPAAPFAARSHYLKIRDRESYEFALVSVAACLELDGPDKVVRSARVALGGVAYTPWRAQAAEDALVGKPLTEASVAAARAAAVQGAQPRRDTGFKVTLAERAVVRALTTIGERP